MKKIILLAICLSTSLAFANRANEGGGGGHPCKEDFLNTIVMIAHKVQKSLPNLTRDDISAVSESVRVIMPNENPGFTVVISEKPIQGCPNTDNPIACSYPRKNKLELYCDPSDDKGWMSLSPERKTKYALHELLWWSKTLDDSNFYYSTGAAKRLFGRQQEVADLTLCLEKFSTFADSFRNFQAKYPNGRKSSSQEGIDQAIASIKQQADACIAGCRAADQEVIAVCQKTKVTLDRL